MVYLRPWHGWCHMKLLPSRRVLCTPYNHAPCHFMQSHVPKVHACLAVTCRLHFRLNDRDLLRATAVTRGWIGYRNKSLHRKLTLEKKILPPLLQGFEPATFQSGVRRKPIPVQGERAWPSGGKELGWQAGDVVSNTSFDSPFSSPSCLWTLSCDFAPRVNETLK